MAWRAASRYVAGRSRSEALMVTTRLLANGHGVSVDLFGERLADPSAAPAVVEDYLSLAVALHWRRWRRRWCRLCRVRQ